MKKIHQVKAVLAGLLLSSSVVPVVMADDIEIYTTLGSKTTSTNPNILFMVDTSGSMDAVSKVKEPYDKGQDYSDTAAATCQPDGIYYDVDAPGETPLCSSGNYFNRTALACLHATEGHDVDHKKISPAQDGSLPMIGTYSDQLAYFDTVTKTWKLLKTLTNTAVRDYTVECFSDSLLFSNPDYMEDGGTGYTSTVPANPAVPHPVWAGGAGNVQLYDGNWLNYDLNPNVLEVDMQAIDQVKGAVEIMVRGNTRVNIGLQVFENKKNEGGRVLYPIENVGAKRNDFFTALKNLSASGATPLSESYYEALLYYGGKAIDYGGIAGGSPALDGGAKDSGDPKYYNSAISSECDKNYIVILTDGTPTQDYVSETRQGVLPGFTPGVCQADKSSFPSPWPASTKSVDYYSGNSSSGYSNRDADDSDNSVEDNCLDELAGWALNNDVAEKASILAHKGDQHIITHSILFKNAVADAKLLLDDTAKKGGGDSYFANDRAELINIFNKIIAGALGVNSTFSSPAVSVNAFNRSTHLDDLYFTLFKPSNGNHWDGNLKKYKLKFTVDINDKDGDGDKTELIPMIAGSDGLNAVDDSTGFFDDFAISYWSAAVDGPEVSSGGAASKLTNTRNVYTYTGTYGVSNGVYTPAVADQKLKSLANRVVKTNTSLTEGLLGIPALKPALITGSTYYETLVDWAAGFDVFSDFGAKNTVDDARPQMGDPLHAEPALVQYGGTIAVPELVAYTATNDGYLHAIDVTTGLEIFSFIPQELLPKLSRVMEDKGGAKSYGLDGSVVPWIYDKNKNGIIETPDDRVIIYVSMRRGGNNIYALDVSDETDPRLLWVIKGGAGDYTQLGQTWSTVNVETIKNSATPETVLIFGGGYDTAQDTALVRPLLSGDATGGSVYIVNAETGARLWSAGSDGVATAEMKYSIPARIVPLDVSGDGFIDRLYAADVGGQIFRFDINNTNGDPLSSSITGGRIANLADDTIAGARRFYYAPDVALIDAPDGKYHALIISSGYRAHPLNESIHDRIFMIKDRNTGLISTGYTTLTESNLKDVTINLAGGEGVALGGTAQDDELTDIGNAEGWYINLDDEANPGTWIGEKGLAEPLIIEGVAVVTTYTPNVTPATTCAPALGLGKVFFLDILDATAAFPSNLDVRVDRHKELVRGGIPPTPNVIITSDGEPTLCLGTECEQADFGLGVRKTYWYEVN